MDGSVVDVELGVELSLGEAGELGICAASALGVGLVLARTTVAGAVKGLLSGLSGGSYTRIPVVAVGALAGRSRRSAPTPPPATTRTISRATSQRARCDVGPGPGGWHRRQVRSIVASP